MTIVCSRSFGVLGFQRAIVATGDVPGRGFVSFCKQSKSGNVCVHAAQASSKNGV